MHRSAYGEMNSPPPLGRNIENLIYQLNRRHDPHLNRILPPHNIQKDWTVYSDLPNSDLRNRFVQLHLQQQHHESATSLSESEFYNEDFNYDEQFTKEKVAMNLSRFGRFLEMLSRLPLPRMSFTGMGLCFLLAIFICPRACCEAILFPSFRLAFGTLYPAYASYKAVRTKNVKEYVKWMMYWIVYAFFTCIETFTDIFLSWFPFYYEFKVIIVLWLLSPATKGSSTLYRKFVHPMLTRREQEIDEYLNQARERGYTAVLQLGSKGVNYATNVIMQTALKTFQNAAINGEGTITTSHSDNSLTSNVRRHINDFFYDSKNSVPRSKSVDMIGVDAAYDNFEGGSSDDENVFTEIPMIIDEEINNEESGAARARKPPKRKTKRGTSASKQNKLGNNFMIRGRRKIKEEPEVDVEID